jgi:bifunctional DNA-binding transcriptional regulator/antitoxin component of YhaV-PrlF toxin-antitoxin module
MRQEIEVSLDEQGHLVIPKDVGEQLGLKLGMTLIVEQSGSDNVRLSPQSDAPTLIDEGGVWVVHGGVDWSDVDTVDLIRRDRDQRAAHLIGLTES